MKSSRRVFALIAVSLVMATLWFVYGSGGLSREADAQQPPADKQDMQAHLDQAAESIVAAAEQGIRSGKSGDELLERTDLSIEALRIIGALGGSNTDDHAEKLLDFAQADANPAVAEVVIRMRLARKMQQWSRLSRSEREKAIDRFVEDVRDAGISPGHVDVLFRFADRLEQANQGELVARALSELLPLAQKAEDLSVQRRAPIMEGAITRLNLVGKPFELKGTLLDGTDFDWESYRGKVVLVDFFANWCEVCRAEAPNLLAVHRAYRDKGFEIVGVSLDEHPELAEMYRKQTGFNFPTLFSSDPRAMEWNSPMAVKYGLTSLPRVILVDQDGIVIDTVARGPRLVMHLRDLLGPAALSNSSGRVGAVTDEPGDDAQTDAGVVPAAFEEGEGLQSNQEDSVGPADPEE